MWPLQAYFHLCRRHVICPVKTLLQIIILRTAGTLLAQNLPQLTIILVSPGGYPYNCRV